MAGVTYDTGALVAAERNDRQMWALHVGYVRLGIVPSVPAPVLAQAWRGGGGQAALSRLLTSCEVEPLTDERARAVGVLCGRAAHDDVIDVAVIEGAVRRDDAVVTSDEAHIRRIAGAAGATLAVVAV